MSRQQQLNFKLNNSYMVRQQKKKMKQINNTNLILFAFLLKKVFHQTTLSCVIGTISFIILHNIVGS